MDGNWMFILQELLFRGAPLSQLLELSSEMTDQMRIDVGEIHTSEDNFDPAMVEHPDKP
jgi:hypothetical protein